MAPLKESRVTLKVDERRIADLAPGYTGDLLVTALPEQTFPVRVEKITPVAEYGDGATTFRVEASLITQTGELRPGMEGVAKIDIDRRRLISIWVEPVIDWFRVWSWRWIPH